MTTASVIAFLQPGVQPGLKARSGGEAGENPFAALLASLGIEAAPAAANATGAQAGITAGQTGAAQTPGAKLSAPLQLLKDIGEAIAKALEEGTELPDFDQLPPEFQALLAQFAQLPDGLHAALVTLIGTDAVAALDELAASAGDAPLPAPADASPPAPAADEGESTQPNATPGTGETAAADAANEPPAPQPVTSDAASAPAETPAASAQTAPAATAPAATAPAETTKTAAAPAPAAAQPVQQTAAAASLSSQSQAAAADDAALSADKRAGAAATDGDDAGNAQAPAKEAAKPAAPATQAASAALANAATPSRTQQQAAGQANNNGTPAKEDAVRAETTARDATRTGLRGLLETLAAGPQATDSATAQAGSRAQAPQALAAAIQSAMAARSSNGAAANAPAANDIASVTAPQGDSILLTMDKPGQTAFASAPARSVTVPAYGSSLPVSQIAVAISSQARAGTRHFDIRLDPPEMGRIDVRLEMNRDGVLNAQLTVDRPETFDALNRDARHLERMLQQSGMKLDGGSIQFSLRDGGGSGNGQGFENQNGGGHSAPAAEAEADMPAPVYARIPSSALVDIEV
ncbi:MAG: flagellar hook-length control protein FliK [Tepidamorphaceae bacterium]|nr:flagellar hook-length control protein FliK [Rhodobiaceae bacterium]MCC0048362.1 flagellar hook-length control protein FliK [Rhodobiaceae bacterium]